MNKEMIKTLINDGWEWVTRNQDATIRIFRGSKPVFVEERGVFENEENLCLQIPSCLFPNITFENSPVELKTLLVDEEEEEQILLKSWVKENFIEETKGYDGYLIRDWNDDVLWVSKEENDSCDAERLSRLCPNKYEKVYLKDIVKKRKVKKIVWYAVDDDGEECFFIEKPKRGESNKGWIGILSDLYEDATEKPIKLTYKVEE